MNIAFFSYEYPEETSGGGIGTYLVQMTELLREAGHRTTVFTATKKEEAFWENKTVFRIPASGWQEFNQILPAYFIPIHNKDPFDVAECTDFLGCGLYVKKMVPNLPIVVKLHSPLYLVDRFLFNPLPFKNKLRFIAGALRKFKFPELPKRPNKINYKEEFELIELAERVSSTSVSIYREMKALNFQLDNKTDFVPYPFEISTEVKTIEARLAIKEKPHIIFIGRLEKRKGVIEIVKAIPKILKVYPTAHFTFIGAPSLSPIIGIDMMTYLKNKLKRHLNSVQFTGKLPYKEITKHLALGDIFIFPSHYESFGLVCCEAMSAGKAVIGSKNGGMSEIIEDNISGLLIAPKKPRLIIKAIIELIENNKLRLDLGVNARNRIKSLLNKENTIGAQVDCYQRAVNQLNIPLSH